LSFCDKGGNQKKKNGVTPCSENRNKAAKRVGEEMEKKQKVKT
jgi:hypothetical protein